MPIEYLKKANPPIQAVDTATAGTVRGMLDTLLEQGEAAARAYARDLDGWSGDIIVEEQAFASAEAALASGVKDDIRFARDRVQDFARRQRDSMQEFSAELLPGLIAGPAPDSVQHRWLLRAGWPLCACRQRHHECGHRLGGGCQEHHRRHAGAQGSRHPPGDPVRDAPVRRADGARAGRRAGRGGAGLRPVQRQARRHHRRPGQPLRGRGQTHAVRPRGHRRGGRADRIGGDRRRLRRPGHRRGRPGRAGGTRPGLARSG